MFRGGKQGCDSNVIVKNFNDKGNTGKYLEQWDFQHSQIQTEVGKNQVEPILNFVCRGHIMPTQGAMNDRSNEEAAQVL